MAVEVPQYMTPGMRVVARGMGVFFIATGAIKVVGLSAAKDFFASVGLPLFLVHTWQHEVPHLQHLARELTAKP